MTQTRPTTEPTDVQPSDGTAEAGEQPLERPVALRLARLHLRTGSYALARVELETAAGAGTLDEEALLDLAEVRWRTDDLTGAGEAAAAYLASGRVALIALVITAEATAALGRPSEGRRLAGRALELANGTIDEVFAGMPRSDVWPARPIERVEQVPLPAPIGADPATAGAAGPAGLGAEVAVPMAAAADSGTASSEPMPDPAGELDAAKAALAAGDRAGAALRLSIVLRLSPALAPAVLDVAAGESGPDFDLVRGDALRLVGRESQARRAFASAARQPSDPPDPADAGAVTEPGAEVNPDPGRES
jgi:hypothetical protein